MDSPTEITFLRESELIRRAASSRNLVLRDNTREYTFYPVFNSEAAGTFNLDGNFVSSLQKHGFSFSPGTKPPRDEMIYLNGHSSQRGVEVFYSDCWAWKRTETNPRLAVYFRLSADERERGIVCEPQVGGNCSGGACHRPTIDKFVKGVADHFPEAHPLIREAANGNFRPVILWSDIGLGGIKSLGRLFNELFGANKNVTELARSTLSPFDPDPDPRVFGVKDRLFALEADQPILFRCWKEQLQVLKASLA